MAAPPSSVEFCLLKKSNDMAEAKAAEMVEKKKQLLAANKQKARMLLLGISTDSYVTATKHNDWNGK